MPDVEFLPILVAALAAFVLGGAYYAALGEQLASAGAGTGDERMPAWKLGLEFLRGLVLAAVIAGLAVQGEIDEAGGGLVLGLALWVGFPAVLWSGAVLHGEANPQQAAIHAGDWLAKLLAIGVIVSVWQ
jgi:Protein of unknown function (DUF1761)